MADERPTEQRNPRSTRLDEMSADEIVALMTSEEQRVIEAVAAAGPALAQAAEAVAESFLAGGTCVYVGAGTSGRIASMDAAEIPPTFGTDPSRFQVISASDLDGGPITGANEDRTDLLRTALDDVGVGPGDCVIGIAASGTTPITVDAVRIARARGAWTCGIANNPATPLLEAPDLGILLDTGPEVLTGSTRLKAGTAQKLALNRISTAAMVLAGRVRSNLMIELKPVNEKLRQRCVEIVSDLLDVDLSAARERLEASDWVLRRAVDDEVDHPG